MEQNEETTLDWSELTKAENAEMEGLMAQAQRLLTKEELSSVGQAALFPVEVHPSPFGEWSRANGLGDGCVTMNWRLYRALLKRKLDAVRREGRAELQPDAADRLTRRYFGPGE